MRPDPGPNVLDRVRFVVFIMDEFRFTLEVDEHCVKVDDRTNLEL